MPAPTDLVATASLERAMGTAVHAIAFTRSFTHPCVARRVESAWLLEDAPRRSGALRVKEWFVCGLAPAEIHALARIHSPGRFAISAILSSDASDEPLRAGFRSLGYRLRATEALMIQPLEAIPAFSAPAAVRIERVKTLELADRLAKTARARQILPEHLADPSPPLRQYAALAGDKIVGWVRSIAGGESTWCSNMFVGREFRRRGIGRAMLSRLLADDRSAGSRNAVLSASHTGALLYPHLGYRRVATLYLFVPPRSPRS